MQVHFAAYGVACGSCIPSSCRNCSKYFLDMQVPRRWFNGVDISRGFGSAVWSLAHFPTCHYKAPSLTASHHHGGEVTMTAAHCHSHVLFPSPQVLLMCFHYQLILILLVALLSNSESCHWHWWVISLFAQPSPDRSDAAALAPDRTEAGKLPCALGSSSSLFSAPGLARNSIVCRSLLLLLCHKFFLTFGELSSQPRKWQVNFTSQLSRPFVGLEGRWRSSEQRAKRTREQ